ncbi:hypothetical protein MMF93_26120 [Streptomyces tubbatahanensis]|uniref:Uncharacterized protein n=1 Tax=Streptomyces tubbatahanensis TaxID=2923272 RepID=A0ABY3XYB3_9ACTN|nr:hypothetical protein [Streptomyces tubbatahanensis]UNS99537.1 hypothetical protein MMF93_26120 [Streptomyces tubbatahanensis]
MFRLPLPARRAGATPSPASPASPALPAFPARCVGPDPHDQGRPGPSEVVVIVVIAVLASALTVTGTPAPAVRDVLGAAGLVALGVLLALRGGSRVSRLVIRGLQAGSQA